MMKMQIADEVAQWLADALVELKGLRGWAWDVKDFEAFRDVLWALGENPDNY